MDSTEQNATENDGAASSADESSPQHSGTDGGDDSVDSRITSSCNSNSRDSVKPDFDDDDQDCSSSARRGKLTECFEYKYHSSDETLFDSLCSLQFSQEALQSEIEKFKDIGNEYTTSNDDSTENISEAAEGSSVDQGYNETCLSGHYGKQISSNSMELQIQNLKEKLSTLESKSEELQRELALKNSRIAELDITVKKKCTHAISLLNEKFKEVESELESLFQQKIDAEVKYLTITKMIQNIKIASALLEKQETLSGSEVQIPNKLEMAASNKDSKVTNRTDELGKYCGEIVGVEETFIIQRRLCKQTYRFFLQLMLFILILWLFVSKLLEPDAKAFVPT